MIVGNLVAGKRIAQACGRDLGQFEDNDQVCKVDCVLHFTHAVTLHPENKNTNVESRRHSERDGFISFFHLQT